MHGTIMLLFFATPMVFAFANLVLPLQIGSPDVAFPRLNAFSYWLYLFGGAHRDVRLRHPGRRGRLRLVRLHAAQRRGSTRPASAATCGSSAWRSPASAPSSARVNMITTVITLRAPGHDDVPDADLHLEHPGHQRCWCCWRSRSSPRRCSCCWLDRQFGAQVFAPDNGGAILWQHLFWFFGHPEVYIVALPFFGIVTEVIPVFSRKPLFGYKGMVFATLAIAALSLTVWAHHMFATGAVLLPFFSFMTFLIAVPTGIKFFNWIGTMWRGSITLRDADAVRRSASWSRSCSAA